MASTKTIVLSDLHFGDPSSSLRHPRVQAGLLDFLGRIDKVVFAGDILDANINSLTRAIEGFYGNLGFRAWLGSVAALGACTTTELVLSPRQNDYIIWNLLSTQTAFMDPLERGDMRWAKPRSWRSTTRCRSCGESPRRPTAPAPMSTTPTTSST